MVCRYYITIAKPTFTKPPFVNSRGVDVTLDIHPGMWHVFPMYSEGCGGGEPIYQATLALNRTADFVRTQASRVSHVAAAAGRLVGGSSAEECASAPSIAWAYDSTHFDGSERPWSEVKPMAGQPQCAAAAVLASSGPAEPRHSDIGGSMLFVVGAVCGALMGMVARDLFPLCWSGFREEHGPRGARDAQVLQWGRLPECSPDAPASSGRVNDRSYSPTQRAPHL